MTSNKQLHANRANAIKSTGPRSQAGKVRSRLNSRKHGLTAKMLIIVGENADDFDQLRAELMDDHDPQSALEFELVERLAGILWRLRRVPSFEAAILEALEAEVAEDMRKEEERRREEEERRRRWHSYVEEEKKRREKEKEEEEEEEEADNEEEETSDEERSAYVGRLLTRLRLIAMGSGG